MHDDAARLGRDVSSDPAQPRRDRVYAADGEPRRPPSGAGAAIRRSHAYLNIALTSPMVTALVATLVEMLSCVKLK